VTAAGGIGAPFNEFSEKLPSVNTTFLTGCAGVAMGALYGFGGIEYDAEGVRAHPALPPGWTRLRITGIHYRGQVYDLDAQPGKPGTFTLQKLPARKRSGGQW
jgi:trehalose/maltose hydrolase-like predicted phosphorylase